MSKGRKAAPAMPNRLAELKEKGLGEAIGATMKGLAEQVHPGMGREEPDWEDEEFRGVCAHFALKIEQTGAEAKVFEAAGLNPKNPFHWRILFSEFCKSLFPVKSQRGRPPKWARYYRQLELDFLIIRKEKPTTPDVQICRIMKKRFPERYGRPNESPSPGRLAKEVKRVGNPKYNPTLRRALEGFLQMLKGDYGRKGITWNALLETELTEQFMKILERHRTSRVRERRSQPRNAD